MDYNKLIELRGKISVRMTELLSKDDFECSIRYLTGIHEYLFKGVYTGNGHFRKYNLNKDEDILNNETVDYPDYHTLPSFLKFAFNDELKIDYSKLSDREKIVNIAKFSAEIWQIHPFMEGNTRTTCIFMEKYLNSMGYKVNNDLFKEHAEYFRNTLVRASYHNEELNIKKDLNPLINFLMDVIMNKEIIYEDLYIKELFNKKTKKRK